MKKPQDSDIFGTKSILYAPRIINDEKVDPNAGFQAKMDAQYDAYTNKIGSSHRGAVQGQKVSYTKVNEKANFDENYHHCRKDADMQSSIFYEPTSMTESRLTERPKITERHIPKHAYNMEECQKNFGKKETIDRQVKTMPENVTKFKGNSSNIFGYDQYEERNGVKNKIQKLVPHQMQWTQHDSIRHQASTPSTNPNINIIKNTQNTESSKALKNQLKESDVYDKKEQQVSNDIKQNNPKNANLLSGQTKVNKQKKLENNVEEKTFMKKQIKENPENSQTKVQIMIPKGWDSKIMEDLSKYCRLNSTKIIQVKFEEGGKGSLVLQKSKRWECITDWLRKDAKLKIRVNS